MLTCIPFCALCPPLPPLPSPPLPSPPRQNETANRLAFLYRVKSREERENRKSTEEISVLLLRNILPDHVAQHYIENGQQGAVSGRVGGAGVGGAGVGAGDG